MIEELEKLRSISEEKRVECAIEAMALSIWLRKLIPANFLLVVGGALLALVAGASMLVEQGILDKTIAGILSLISAGFTIIHNKLNCDQHQAECRKLKALNEGLSEDYASLQTVSDIEALRSRLQALNSERAQIKKNASAWAPPNSLKKAKEIISEGARPNLLPLHRAPQ